MLGPGRQPPAAYGKGNDMGDQLADLLRVRIPKRLKAEAWAAAKSRGMELSTYVRLAIKSQIREQKAPTPADKAQIVNVIRDLEGAARNLNQLARAANQVMLGQGTMPLVEEMEDVARRVDRLALDAFRILRIWA